MTTTKRVRKARPSVYRPSEESRLRLMLAAEEQAAAEGLGGLSARRISEKAGQRNNMSVQYHFGSIEGLLDALLRYRTMQLDAIRRRRSMKRLGRCRGWISRR